MEVSFTGGRPLIAKEVRDLIRRMSLENRFWGATKIHGELLKLGIQVAQSTVSICGSQPPAIRRPSGWRARSPKRFPGTVHRNISFATTTEHSVLHSRLVCEQWGSGTGPRHIARPGKMAMLNA